MKKFMMILVLLLSFLLNACGKQSDSPSQWVDSSCLETAITANDERPDVLIIGDSISLGYTPYVQLDGYDIVHNHCNARSTPNGVDNIDQWLSQRDQWDAISFNHGIHDINLKVPLNEYQANLRIIGTKIKAKTSKVIFFTTTRIPEANPYADEGDDELYNAAAIEVMNELGITVYDLNAVSETITHLHKVSRVPGDVHYTSNGSSVLGEFVTNAFMGIL